MEKLESSESEMLAHLGGVAKQLDAFLFLFGVELGRLVLNMADNLAATLQSSDISANECQSFMQMTVTTLQSIRSEDSPCFGKWLKGKGKNGG